MDSDGFSELVVEAVKAHMDHGGWYETEDGLWCRSDDALVIPSSSYLAGPGGG